MASFSNCPEEVFTKPFKFLSITSSAKRTNRTLIHSDLNERTSTRTELTFEKDLTALLIVDLFNDFISEGGKLWPSAKAVAEANNCVGNMRDVLRASLVRCSARSLDCLHWALSAPSIKSMELDAFRSDLSTNWRENIMKAFILDHYGSNDGVRAGEMPDPELRDDDVLVEIHAASVNPLDFKIRDGKLKLILPYRLPFILGNDLAGVVVRVGSRVRRFKPGDEVYARTDKDRIGSFAEFISIKEDAVAIKPKKLTMEEAASIPLVGLTAWQALIERANLKKGLRVLIHAGSGGVGTFAIQLAKHVGAIVATTTSTENLDWVKRLGADIVIDYRKDDFETILHDYDVVFDTLGGEVLEKSIRVLKPGGKLISIAGLPDSDFAKELGLSRILRLVMYFMSYRIREKAKRHHVSYSFLFMRPSGDQLREIGSLVDSGIIRPVVDRVFPFESTKEALAYVEKGRAKGKVIVKVR